MAWFFDTVGSTICKELVGVLPIVNSWLLF
jgi:hypothetical protein